MNPPFTEAEFFQVLVDYNEGVWPTQLIMAALAVLALALAFRRDDRSHRVATLVLGLLWLWMGVVYHWLHFTVINPAAWAFGSLFVIQAAVFLWLALRAEPLRYRPDWDAFGWLGGAFMAYGLVLYPMLGSALGHTYPAQPTFGLPCPTTIFTVGVLLWAKPRVHPAVLAIPVLWSLIGANAAWLFGVAEDWALPVAGLVGGAMILAKNRRESTAVT